MGSQEGLSVYHDQTRAAIEEVLSRPEFSDLRTDFESYWLRFIEWLRDVLLGIGQFFEGLPSWLYWPIVAWLVLTLLAILGHFIYVLVGVISAAATRRAVANKDDEGGRGELLGIRELDFESVYQRAREYLASGNWTEAPKFLYVAAILWLDRQGWICFKASKTNHDYLAEMARRPSQGARFRQLTARFESTVYGGEPSTAEKCREMVDLVEVLLREVTPVVAF